jgi:hypothetical protein
MALTKIPFSGSTHGRPVLVASTATGAGTTIHTAQATTTDGLGDEVVMYAYNSNSTAETVTVGFGGTTDPDDLIKVSVPANTYVTVLSGLLLRNALVVKAFSTTASKVNISGYVIRSS